MNSPSTLMPLIGHAHAEAAFIEAMGGGRLHHGWLIEGPLGVGKARLALRLAVRLLGGDPDKVADPVALKVGAGNHPDFRQLMRKPDEKGKLPQDIAVDDVREFLGFFTLKAALGGRRIGIIDSLDELNRFGANAILKTLEEPPPGAFLILLTHGSRPVLPTIRSRCRRLRLAALSGSETRQVLEAASTAEDPVNAERVAAMAPGRPGQALRLARESGMAAGAAVAAIAAQWPRPGEAALAGFVMATGADAEGLEAGGLAILQWLSQKAREARGREQAGWARAWLDTSRDLAAARELAMDPTQVAALISERLQALSKR